jgi:hypothetical protein
MIPEMYGPGYVMAMAHAAQMEAEKKAAGEAKSVKKQIPKGKRPTLGQLNPMFNPPDLGNPERVDALKMVTTDEIMRYGGRLPDVFDSRVITSLDEKKQAARLFAKFELAEITDQQIAEIEKQVKLAYPLAVRTRTNSSGDELPIGVHPPAEKRSAKNRDVILGWYMGPNTGETDSTHTGVFLARNLGTLNAENFTSAKPEENGFLLEVREAGLPQVEVAELITQISAILGGREPIDHRTLYKDLYNKLIGLGLRDFPFENVYGLDEIRRILLEETIYPLADPDYFDSIGQSAKNKLLCGVWGTGKTLLQVQLLREDHGILCVPIDAKAFGDELIKKPEDQTMLPTLSRVTRSTGLKTLLLIDEIEQIAREHSPAYSAFSNNLAGKGESGIHVIAATNFPRELSATLVQPERLDPEYVSLPPAEAHFGILASHAPMYSKDGDPLYRSEEERTLFLMEVAKLGDGLTSRHFSDIATIAHDIYYAERKRQLGKTQLTSENMKDYYFEIEHWDEAYGRAVAKYNRKEMKDKDNDIRRFVQQVHEEGIGFKTRTNGRVRNFSNEAYSSVENLRLEQSNGTL